MPVGPINPVRTRDLRRRVLRPGLAADAPLPGDDLPGALHLAATDEAGTVLCTCFVFPDPCAWLPGRPAWHLRQMATDPDHRGTGLGASVVAAAAAAALVGGAEILWCHARETAAGFYARQGFAVHGDVFLDEQHPIPHLRMWLELVAAPTSSDRAGRSERA